MEKLTLGDLLALIGMIGGTLVFIGGVVWAYANHNGRIARAEEEIESLHGRVDTHAGELKIVVRLDERMQQVQESNKRIESQNHRIEEQNRRIWSEMHARRARAQAASPASRT